MVIIKWKEGYSVKENKVVLRFFASTMLAAMAYGGCMVLLDTAAGQEETVRPLLNLTSGEVVDPATAPEVTKYSDSTAKEFAEMVFGEAEAAPELNEFLSRFTCSACGKRCLLTSPRCSKGKGSQEKATAIYQEMFPEVEVFAAADILISIRV